MMGCPAGLTHTRQGRRPGHEWHQDRTTRRALSVLTRSAPRRPQARPVQSEWRIQLHLSPPCKPRRSTTILYLHRGRPACNGLLKSKSLIWDVDDHSVRAAPVRAHFYWVSSNTPIVAIRG